MSSATLPLFFAITLLVSAALLFVIQPMAGKMILPVLGGSPAVWNTCMVFFQAALLAGYLYAHALTTWLGVRRQAILHTGLLLLSLLLFSSSITARMPIDPAGAARQWVLPGDPRPVLGVLALLAVSVGLPFFVVSASAPLLQRWFASTGHHRAKDPYFLYAASSLGSMLGLLSYPALIEPHLRLIDQSWLWAAGYGLLSALTVACAALVWRSPPSPGNPAKRRTRGDKASPFLLTPSPLHPPTTRIRLRWLAFAFVPSSLMLGATTYITTDIAAIPLLWVLPLALYLLSFILVFARWLTMLHKSMISVMPGLVLLLVYYLILPFDPLRYWEAILLHLAVLFVVAMVCHGELAFSRPPAQHMTEFYLLMSVGGVLGGMFNALIAPLIFTTVAEYRLTLVFGCLLLPPVMSERKPFLRWVDIGIPAILGVLTAALILGLPHSGLTEWLGQFVETNPDRLVTVVVYWLPVALCYLAVDRPIRFGLGVAAVLLATTFGTTMQKPTVYAERSFFGVLKVERARVSGHEFHQLWHGTTLHGRQSHDPKHPQYRYEPLNEYHRTGPIGRALETFSGPGARPPIAIIGLGAGTLAAYGKPGQYLTFYEIDPAVLRIAYSPDYFTYLHDSEERGVKLDVVLGDGRLRLAKTRDKYGIIIIDAFNSDAIPVHLITREAVALYLDRLAPDGILAFHISNQHLRLEPVLGNLAEALGLVGLVQNDRDISEAGKLPSHWAVLARSPTDLNKLAADDRWQPLAGQRGLALWTDDFSNLFSVFKWD